MVKLKAGILKVSDKYYRGVSNKGYSQHIEAVGATEVIVPGFEDYDIFAYQDTAIKHWYLADGVTGIGFVIAPTVKKAIEAFLKMVNTHEDPCAFVVKQINSQLAMRLSPRYKFTVSEIE